ncbi:MAG: ATP-binding protein [Christensenellaceae bacterium]|jgi:signal transduction histidine kinase
MKHIKTKFFLLFILTLLLAGITAFGVSILIGSLAPPGANLEAMIVVGFGLRQMITLLACVGTAAGFFYLVSRRTAKPIVELSKATREVAQGNLDVQVKETARHDEMSELERNFNQMTRALKKSQYLQQDYISSVSHEIKTPISSILGYAKLLCKDDIAEEDRKEYSAIITEESERLLNLSSNILRLSALDCQEIPDPDEEFSLDEQIRSMILLLEPQWLKKQIQIVPELEPVKVFGNDDLYCQVWINLIGNAIKFSSDGGKIYIRLHAQDNMAVASIKDEGIGMDEETQTRIFEQFFQGDSSHKNEGNGLGLAIVKRIVDCSGGQILVNSELGNGTEFRIFLPLTHTN